MLKNFEISWTANEVDSVSDEIDGTYRFVSSKNNPNHKDYYSRLLNSKLKALVVNPEKTFRIKGYKGYKSDFIKIIVECPHKVKSYLTFLSAQHAQAKDLNMKWSIDCIDCFRLPALKKKISFENLEFLLFDNDETSEIDVPIIQSTPNHTHGK